MKKIIIFFALVIFISACEKKGVISYPEKGKNGDNILSMNQLKYSGELSMAANLSKDAKVYVTIEPLLATADFGLWWYDIQSNEKWEISDYENNFQTFSSKKDKKICDLEISFSPRKYTVKIYENGEETMTRTKTIEVK